VSSASTRLLGYSFWEVLVYLANAVLSSSSACSYGRSLRTSAAPRWPVLVGQGALVSAVVVAVRLGWGFSVPYLVRLIDRRQSQAMRRVGARERLLLGWSGHARGGVAGRALALPLDFPMRNLILFLTFSGDPGHAWSSRG
jgi:CPA1 family monovalent cation:H+ antiporter